MAARTRGKTKKRPVRRTAGSAKKTLRERRDYRQSAAVLLMAAAALLCVLVFLPGVNVWRALHFLLFGLFGPLAYALPPLFAYLSVAVAMDKPFASIRVRLIEALLLMLFLCGTLQVFLVGRFPGFAALYRSGTRLASGGVAGGLTGGPFFALFGEAGAAATLIILSIADLFFLTDLTIVRIIRALQNAKAKHAAAAAQARAAAAEAPAKEKKRKKKFEIDLPLTDEEEAGTAEKMPELDTLMEKIKDLRGPRDKAENAETDRTPPPWPEDTEAGTGGNEKPYEYPPLSLLDAGRAPDTRGQTEELKDNAERLVETLRSFGVETRITGICPGPAVTRYEIQPAAGVKISRITTLADDIALSLAAGGVRIEAPIPNKSAVGIEVPNKNVSIVHIRSILESAEFVHASGKLTMALGNDIAGRSTVGDIGKMPHLLIAGATGSGKSVCINSIIVSLLYKAKPDEVRFLMIDPKVVELGVYNGIPHLLVPVVTDPRKAAGALNWAVSEMQGRYKAFAENNVRDLRGYNALAAKSEDLKPMPQVVIIIDELSDLMMVASKDVEDAICRLAQMARAAGMHLVIATQRPSVDVITGVIKANIPSRIAFAVSSQVDSRTILDSGGAEKLLGRGDMLFLPIGASKPMRVQGCFVSDKEVEDVVAFVKKNAEAEYDEEVAGEIEKQATKEEEKKDPAADDVDPMFTQAAECVIDAGQASTSMLQRRLKLGYSHAARIVDEMEARGIVGPPDGSKPRKVLISRQQWMEMRIGRAP